MVMCAKLFAFLITNSGSMLGEAIHSFADVLNQGLLLLGVKRAERQPDEKQSRGYGREEFVWSLISAVGIFFLGCGVTLYHGVALLLHPHEHQFSSLEWYTGIGVLSFSLLVEGFVLIIAYRSARRLAGDEPLVDFLKHRAEPALVAVLLEDSAACLGVLFAFFGLGMSSLTGSTIWDAIGTILIALLLGVIALWLVSLNARFLVGRGLQAAELGRVSETMQQHQFIEQIDHVHSEAIGAGRFELHLDVDFDEDELVKSVDINLSQAYEEIDSEEEFIRFCHRYGAEAMRIVYQTIDQLENELRDEVDGLEYIDIEPN